MAAYEVEFERRVGRSLARLPAGDVRSVIARARALGVDPRPAGCIKIKTLTDCYRVRQGDYRIIYEVDDEARRVRVRAVEHRRDAYR